MADFPAPVSPRPSAAPRRTDLRLARRPSTPHRSPALTPRPSVYASMASGELETGSAAAATAPELRLYHFGYEGASRVARLELRSALPAAASHANAAVDGFAEHSQFEPGFYLAVLEAGMVVDVGHLSSLDGRRFGAEEEGDETSVEQKEEGKDNKEEEGEEGKETSVEKGEDTSVEEEVEGEETTEEEWEETSVEEVEEDSSDEKQDEWEKNSEGGDYSRDDLQLRIWPGMSYAALAFLHGGCWRMTKSFSVKWLQSQEKVELLMIIDNDFADDDTISSRTNSSHWLKGYTLRLDFGGALLYPEKFGETLNRELNPTLDSFKIIKRLGKGVAGKVYQCAYKDAHIHASYAIKIVKIDKYDDIDAYHNKEPREVNVMSCFNDPKIVRFYKAWITTECYEGDMDEDDDSDVYSDIQSDSDVSESDPSKPAYVVIQMEYCIRTVEKTPIEQIQVDIEKSWVLFEKITEAVGLIHEKDVKPSNILVGVDGEIKIGDFGHACWVSCYKNGGKGTPNRGTQIYMAPELDCCPVTYKVDIYSLGVTFLEIFCSFGSGHERCEVLTDFKNGKDPKDFLGDLVLLKELTASDPVQRPSAVDILEYIGRRK